MTEQNPEQPAAEAPATEAPPEQPPPAPEPPKPTETVEFWKQKAREQEGRAKANAEAARRLKDIEDRDLSELEKFKRDATENAAKLAEYERTTVRQRVALEKGIPGPLVARLQGTTEEEVAADADALLALLNKTTSPKPDPGQGPRPTTPEAQAEAEYEAFYPNPTTRK